MSNILIFSKSRTARDPRVRKQVEFLSRRYTVTNLGYGEYEHPGVEHINLSRGARSDPDKSLLGKILRASHERRLISTLLSRILGFFPSRVPFIHTAFKDFLTHRDGAAVELRKVLRRKKFDLILANDFSALSTCVWAANGRKVLYDAHEYTLGQASHSPSWMREHFPYIEYALKKYLPRCSKVITVSDGIADEYARVFGIPRPEVVRNTALYIDQRPTATNSDIIRIVHHGVAARQRYLEYMIDAVLGCDKRFELDFFLVVKDKVYLETLKKRVDADPRIRFRNPVPMSQISQVLNAYDIGMYILPPSNFNHVHALPNKLFEFIQARLAIAVAPSPEMARLVRKYDLGVVAEDFSVQAMIKVLNSLSSAQIEKYKQNSDRYARELSAESEMERLESIVNELLKQS